MCLYQVLAAAAGRSRHSRHHCVNATLATFYVSLATVSPALLLPRFFVVCLFFFNIDACNVSQLHVCTGYTDVTCATYMSHT